MLDDKSVEFKADFERMVTSVKSTLCSYENRRIPKMHLTDEHLIKGYEKRAYSFKIMKSVLIFTIRPSICQKSDEM